ncbi:hypothetical protein ACTFIY_011411 [Dictyostelium cf. discoideum]
MLRVLKYTSFRGDNGTSTKYNETTTANGDEENIAIKQQQHLSSPSYPSSSPSSTTVSQNNDNLNHNVHSLNNSNNNNNSINEKNKINDNNNRGNSDDGNNNNSSNNNNSNNSSNNNNNNNNRDNDEDDDEDDEEEDNNNNNSNNNKIRGYNDNNDINDIFSINFSSWSKSKDNLIENGVLIFEESGLYKELNLSKSSILNFLSIVASSYRNNPFHSFNHAIAVTQTIFLILLKTNLFNILSPIEKLSIIIASICHDLDHPALSNRFQINMKSSIAVLYNNKSVLENHHLSICLGILESNIGNELLSTLTVEEKEQFLKRVKILILATDMENHFTYKKQFDDIISTFSWDNSEHRDLLLIMFLKSADISNELRSFDISNKWANALMEEFFNQSDLEKLNNLPLTPFMEREKVVLHLTQVSFIEKFLLPSYQSLQNLLPSLEDFVQRIIENKEIWSNNGSSSSTTSSSPN